MREIDEYDNLLAINNIRFYSFHYCPPIVPQIFRGTNLFSAGLRAGDKNIVHGGQKWKGAVLHCCRAAPGVNNRSLASDLRWQRYVISSRSIDGFCRGDRVGISWKFRKFVSINRNLPQFYNDALYYSSHIVCLFIVAAACQKQEGHKGQYKQSCHCSAEVNSDLLKQSYGFYTTSQRALPRCFLRHYSLDIRPFPTGGLMPDSYC